MNKITHFNKDYIWHKNPISYHKAVRVINNSFDSKYNWSKSQLIYGKFIGEFFYWSKPIKRFTLIWRPDNHNDSYGESFSSYNSLKAAEQAIKSFGNLRFSLVDETTKHISHYSWGCHYGY